jgi:hypothetical protein
MSKPKLPPGLSKGDYAPEAVRAPLIDAFHAEGRRPPDTPLWKHRLAAISNTDDDLIAGGLPFTEVSDVGRGGATDLRAAAREQGISKSGKMKPVETGLIWSDSVPMFLPARRPREGVIFCSFLEQLVPSRGR